mgnify:CR=1 FL=1
MNLHNNYNNVHKLQEVLIIFVLDIVNQLFIELYDA